MLVVKVCLAVCVVSHDRVCGLKRAGSRLEGQTQGVSIRALQPYS